MEKIETDIFRPFMIRHLKNEPIEGVKNILDAFPWEYEIDERYIRRHLKPQWIKTPLGEEKLISLLGMREVESENTELWITRDALCTFLSELLINKKDRCINNIHDFLSISKNKGIHPDTLKKMIKENDDFPAFPFLEGKQNRFFTFKSLVVKWYIEHLLKEKIKKYSYYWQNKISYEVNEFKCSVCNHPLIFISSINCELYSEDEIKNRVYEKEYPPGDTCPVCGKAIHPCSDLHQFINFLSKEEMEIIAAL